MVKTSVITEIYPKIFRLGLTLSLELKDVNIYLIAGEVPTLIDTGLKNPFVIEAIKALMKKAGVRHIDQILLTHSHIDHSGNAATLAVGGTEIFTSTIDYEEWLVSSKEDNFTHLFEWMMLEWDVPMKKLREMYDNSSYQFKTRTIIPSRVSFLQPDDVIQAGDYRVQAIFTPGHTRGHFSYWLEQEKLIFSGDVLLPDQIPVPGAWLEGKTHVSGLPDYLNSIRTLESLKGQLYFPAHGAPQNDPSIRCRAVLDQIMSNVEKHIPAEDVYKGASRYGKRSSKYLFYYLHHVFGWETVQEIQSN